MRKATNGASLLCLAMSVTATTILARNVATQIVYDFDRVTGFAHGMSTAPFTTVRSIPSRLSRRTFTRSCLSLDRKYREGEYRRAEDPEWRMPPEQARLTEEEKRGLLFVSHFYPENPI